MGISRTIERQCSEGLWYLAYNASNPLSGRPSLNSKWRSPYNDLLSFFLGDRPPFAPDLLGQAVSRYSSAIYYGTFFILADGKAYLTTLEPIPVSEFCQQSLQSQCDTSACRLTSDYR